jgi:transcriptional regulator with XRE-family HTH domain
MTRFAHDLRLWRHAYWLTQAEAAERLGISLTTYSRWERAGYMPPLSEERRVRSLMDAMDAGAAREREGGVNW